jgi:rare lipoprotein A
MTPACKPERGRPRLRSSVGALVVLAGALGACAGPPSPAPLVTPPAATIAPMPPVSPASTPPRPPSVYPSEVASFVQTGLASWYGRDFHRQPTASGERFDMRDLTAAHRTLALGTVVRVTNLTNNRSVLVRINDRGPFAKGRVIDVSRLAAQRLDMATAGVAPVRVEVFDADQSRRIAENAPR